jgi:hypothetical protein
MSIGSNAAMQCRNMTMIGARVERRDRYAPGFSLFVSSALPDKDGVVHRYCDGVHHRLGVISMATAKSSEYQQTAAVVIVTTVSDRDRASSD